MSIFTIDTGLNQTMTQDIFKYLSILMILHILVGSSDIENIGLFSDKLFNENFMIFLLLLAISVIAYHLVVLELIEIK